MRGRMRADKWACGHTGALRCEACKGKHRARNGESRTRGGEWGCRAYHGGGGGGLRARGGVGAEDKEDGESLSITLRRNPDILGNLAEIDLPGLVRVGFAAETQDLVANAQEKLRKKKLDMIVANDAVPSIGADSSALTLISRDATIERLPTLSKEESARYLVQRLAELISKRDST